MKCAGGHFTSECPIPRENLEPKCANCNNIGHMSKSDICPVYQSIVQRKREKYEQTTSYYIPAPPPATNYWENRTTREQKQNREEELLECPRPGIPQREEFPLPPAPRVTRGEAEEGRTINPRDPRRKQGNHYVTAPEAEPTQRRMEGWMDGRREESADQIQPAARQTGSQRVRQNYNNNDFEGVQIDPNQEQISNFQQLNVEFQRLNEHIDLDRFVLALKKLNDKLDKQTTAFDKFQLMASFMNYINKNGI